MRVNFSPLNSPSKGSGIIKSFAGNYKSRYNALRRIGNRIIWVTFLEEADHNIGHHNAGVKALSGRR